MPYVFLPEPKMPKKTKKKRKKKNPEKKLKEELKDENAGIKKDIKELQTQKQKVIAEAKKSLSGLKGIKKFAVKSKYVAKISKINRAIKEREQYMTNKFKIKNLEQKTEFEKARSELKELQDRNKIKPDEVFGTQDLFKI